MAASLKPEASAGTSAKPLNKPPDFPLFKTFVLNEASSSPSLASDVSSHGSGNIEPSDAKNEPRVTIALKSGELFGALNLYSEKFGADELVDAGVGNGRSGTERA